MHHSFGRGPQSIVKMEVGYMNNATNSDLVGTLHRFRAIKKQAEELLSRCLGMGPIEVYEMTEEIQSIVGEYEAARSFF